MTYSEIAKQTKEVRLELKKRIKDRVKKFTVNLKNVFGAAEIETSVLVTENGKGNHTKIQQELQTYIEQMDQPKAAKEFWKTNIHNAIVPVEIRGSVSIENLHKLTKKIVTDALVEHILPPKMTDPQKIAFNKFEETFCGILASFTASFPRIHLTHDQKIEMFNKFTMEPKGKR